jgi:hypothetical protein
MPSRSRSSLWASLFMTATAWPSGSRPSRDETPNLVDGPLEADMGEL